MTTTASLILDLVILAVLVYSVVMGARRGFILTLCSLLAVVLALAGGWYAANHWSQPLQETLEPVLAQKLTDQMTANQTLTAGDDDSSPLLGNYSQAIQEQLASSAQNIQTATANQLAESLSGLLAKSILFLVGFVVVLVVWHLLCRLLNLVARLPGLRTLNKGLGGLVGLIRGILLLMVARWALCDLLGWIPASVIAESRVLPMLSSLSIFSLLGF
jgi:uncharacterized membrane protein required for colicin V production